MGLPLWLLLSLYFASEVGLSATAKLVGDPVGLLPTSCAASLAVWAVLLGLGWWRHLRADRAALACGVAGACVVSSVTLAYALPGVSMVLPKVLMVCGVLLLAPLLDRASGEAPRLWSRATLCLCLVATAVLCAAWHKARLEGTAAALCCACGCLAGYALKLRLVGHRRGDVGFFVTSTTATAVLSLLAALGLCAAWGRWPTQDPRALLSGAASTGCGVFGVLVLMRPRRTHSRLVPLHRSAGLLAVAAAQVGLRAAHAWGAGAGALLRAAGAALSPGEWVGVALMLGALWAGRDLSVDRGEGAERVS